jgi:hypothetical protein
MVDDYSDGLGKTLGDCLDKITSEPEPKTQSEISSMQKLLEIQCKMLNHAIQHKTQLCTQNTKMMEANPTYLIECGRRAATRMNIFKTTCPVRAAVEGRCLRTLSTPYILTSNPTQTYFWMQIPTELNMQLAFSSHGIIIWTQLSDKQ